MFARVGPVGPLLSPIALAEQGALVEVTGPVGSGATSLLLSLLAPVAKEGPVAYLDVRGAVSPVAAAEAGCSLERLAFVSAPHPDGWAKALAYLLDGVRAVAAEVPRGVPAAALRALAGRARSRSRLVVLAPIGWQLPEGLVSGRLSLSAPRWAGPEEGRGHLDQRLVSVRLEGKLTRGGVIEGGLRPPSLALIPQAGQEGRRLQVVGAQ